MIDIKIGDYVICEESGVKGTVVRRYVPTACEEQIMVETNDGREYHAPARMWRHVLDFSKITSGSIDGSRIVAGKMVMLNALDNNFSSLLNPYGEYVVEFAKNHNISISEAMKEPMVKARQQFFEQTGR